MPRIRTFIGVEVAGRVGKRALELVERLSGTEARVKWVGPSELHWTLKFLGDVHPGDLPELCAAIDAAVADMPSFEIEAVGAGAFPDPQRPRTVWLGVGDGQSEFVTLHDRLQEQLGPLGFRDEHRRFRPHLTLGRVRNSTQESIDELGQLVADHATFSAGRMEVADVVIFSSRLTRSGPIYEAISRAELGG
ncbi:MAG: RNA 2',3'-cyclic phosphodiesterase [Planctomycetia bacterium]|nr:RNA 2',3'-cyclic phosphodiesterase [Planctomycetia bacterium]